MAVAVAISITMAVVVVPIILQEAREATLWMAAVRAIWAYVVPVSLSIYLRIRSIWAGAAGVAVVSAVFAAVDGEAAAREIRGIVDGVLR